MLAKSRRFDSPAVRRAGLSWVTRAVLCNKGLLGGPEHILESSEGGLPTRIHGRLDAGGDLEGDLSLFISGISFNKLRDLFSED